MLEFLGRRNPRMPDGNGWFWGCNFSPVAKELKTVHIDCITSWFADNNGAASSFESIDNFFEDLSRFWPDFGYIPKPSKSILIVHPYKMEDANVFFNVVGFCGFQITTGSRYLGDFIVNKGSRDVWLLKKMSDWEASIMDISDTAHKFPQSAFVGLQKSLQHEWGFVQQVVPDIGPQF